MERPDLIYRLVKSSHPGKGRDDCAISTVIRRAEPDSCTSPADQRQRRSY